MRRWLWVLMAFCAFAAYGLVASNGTQAQSLLRNSDPWLRSDQVVMQGLDKITARISTFRAPVGRIVRFGTLEITARDCRKRPPEEAPEVAAFIEIVDRKPGEPALELLTGWMFASSPALNALEHPVYDVWVIDCSSSSTQGQSPPSQ
jgi:hypothetical protein